MTEANAAVDPAETETITPEIAEKPADAPVVEKATDSPADASKPTGEVATGESAADKGEGDKPAEVSWPDDWRERLAGDDDTFLRMLKRYSSPNTFAKGFKEREEIIRSGKVKRDMPDAKDEKAMAEWRKEQGIPDDPSGYVLPEPLTSRLVDDDKPVLANFTEFAHKNNLPPAYVAKAAEWYVETQEFAAEQRAAADKIAHEACEDALRKDWAHGEYKANTKLAHSFLESIPGLSTDFATARLPNGRMLVQEPAFIAWAADMGREKFGDLAFVSGDSERKHMARKTEIESIMHSDINKYRQEGLDKEYAQILEREKKRAS